MGYCHLLKSFCARSGIRPCPEHVSKVSDFPLLQKAAIDELWVNLDEWPESSDELPA